jgi:rhodanese-related sulfurtransferase
MRDIVLFMQHHWQLSLALIVVLIFLVIIEFIRLKKNAVSISPAFVTQLINRQNAVVVDVRNADAFATGHIVDAISIPHQEIMEKQQKLEKFKAQPLVIVCNAGIESAKVATQLKERGYTVYVLGGGIQAWRRAELPLVKG